jgi:hypothetical protein
MRKWVSCGITCGYCCRITCGLSAGPFASVSSSFLAGNSAGKFLADFKNCRKQLPTKVLAGNQNPQEKPQEILADFWSNSAGKSAGK